MYIFPARENALPFQRSLDIAFILKKTFKMIGFSSIRSPMLCCINRRLDPYTSPATASPKDSDTAVQQDMLDSSFSSYLPELCDRSDYTVSVQHNCPQFGLEQKDRHSSSGWFTRLTMSFRYFGEALSAEAQLAENAWRAHFESPLDRVPRTDHSSHRCQRRVHIGSGGT